MTLQMTYREQIEQLEAQHAAKLAEAERALTEGDIAGAAKAQTEAVALTAILESTRKRAQAQADRDRTERQLESERRFAAEENERVRQRSERQRIGRLAGRYAVTMRWMAEIGALRERADAMAAYPPSDIPTLDEIATVKASPLVDIDIPHDGAASTDLERAAR